MPIIKDQDDFVFVNAPTTVRICTMIAQNILQRLLLGSALLVGAFSCVTGTSFAAPLTNAQKAACGARASQLAPEALPWVVPSYLNGNPRCDTKACKGNMTKTECTTAALSFIACAHWEWDFSACLSQELGQGYVPDAVHMRKIREDYEDGLTKCPGRCLGKYGENVAKLRDAYYKRASVVIDKVLKGKSARIVGSKVGSRACCLLKGGSKLLTRVLGPIGVAYTVGEVGAAGIGAGSDFYVATLEKNFACSQLPNLSNLVTSSCRKATDARNDFSSFASGCNIYFEVQGDGCGPIGLKKFNPYGSGCDRETCDETYVGTAADKFSTAAEKTLGCLSAIRLKNEYQKVCDGQPACIPPGT